jgi:aminomuconate-semialdehyde/2-hydroxymuconate-6-semialdehyde dehydrogenase
MQRLTNFIANADVPPGAGRYLPVLDPATGQVYAEVPESDASDVDAAVAAASEAFPAWSRSTVETRSRAMLRLADLIEANVERFAVAESRNTGKPITLARTVDIPRSTANFRYFATAILHSSSELHEFDGSGTPNGVPALNYTLRRPRGVAGLISPWNLPLYLLTWKIAPAIATGNTVVCKPSEVTPVSAAMLGELVREAGIPPGVINIIHGPGADTGSFIVRHAGIPTISFTGSTAIGKWIAHECGLRLKRVSLELGGKNAAIVFDDADLPATLDTLARSSFSNSGQICLCSSRILVHERLMGEVVAGLVERARALRQGDPSDPATQLGAVVSRAQLEKIEVYMHLAREAGATVHLGGKRPDPATLPARCRDGFFFPPTILSGLPPECRPEQEEIFGPIVSITPFRDEDEAIRLANATPYGLAAMIFTRDVTRAHRAAAAVDAGLVWVNCWMVRDLRTPFGGTKHSGLGREGGLDALRFFTEPRNVCIRL